MILSSLHTSLVICTCYVSHPSEKQEQEQHRGIKSRQVDTNILALRFDTLGGRASIHTGDVVVCKNDECAAVLSHLSKVTEKTDSDKKV